MKLDPSGLRSGCQWLRTDCVVSLYVRRIGLHYSPITFDGTTVTQSSFLKEGRNYEGFNNRNFFCGSLAHMRL